MPDYADVQFTRWAAAQFTPASPYVVGDTYARRETPRFEYKPSATGYTGGGYARLRSTERRPKRPGRGTDDVFVSVHRLAAVVWCYPAEQSIEALLSDLAAKDVHHTLGMPAANGEAFVETREHGAHASITQAQRRAWAADAKRQRERDDSPTCAAGGCDADPAARVSGERYCLDHATANADGEQIEVL